jgi:hypothetical protein
MNLYAGAGALLGDEPPPRHRLDRDDDLLVGSSGPREEGRNGAAVRRPDPTGSHLPRIGV